MSITEIWHESFLNTNIDYKLGAMAAKVATQNFEDRYATFLIFNITLYYGVEVFLNMFNYSIIINRGMINPRLAKVLRQYVIFGSDIIDLEQLLDTLKELEMINTGKFIFICESQVSGDCDEKAMTTLFWEYKIVDVAVIKSEEKEAVGYTYFPISDGDCNNIEPIKLTSSHGSQYFTTNRGNVFGMKLKKLSYCPLFVSTFIQIPYMDIVNGTPVGADGDLLKIIVYGLNTSLEMMTPHRGVGWGFRQENGTWAGSLADVYEDLANISMTSAALTLARFSDFQLSRSYYASQVVWITHPAKLENEALKLLRPFASSTQIALLVSYVLVILCALIIKTNKCASIMSIYSKRENVAISKSILFYSWVIFTGQAVIKLPTKSAFLQITILWVYYCLLIRTAYQVYLISSLKGTFYEDQFKTIEDAINANYPFGGGSALKDYYIENPTVYNNWIAIESGEYINTVLQISKGKKFVLAMNKDTAKMLMKIHKISLHILPEEVVSSPSVIYFKKYSPLVESMNLVLSGIVTSGLPDKVHNDYTSFKTARRASEDEEEPLQIIHFTACYVVLATGWLVSLLFFSLEFYFGRIYKHPTSLL